MFVKKSANFAGNKAREELISSAKICWRAKDNFVYRSITTITIAQWIDNNLFLRFLLLSINLIYFLEIFSNLKNKLESYFNLSRIFFSRGKKEKQSNIYHSKIALWWHHHCAETSNYADWKKSRPSSTFLHQLN